MNKFLILAFLFFVGSTFGWILEVFFRKFFSRNNPEHKWINPGFCTGPYLPLYGSGLCVLYLIASLNIESDYSIPGLYPIGCDTTKGDGYAPTYMVGKDIADLALERIKSNE